MSERVDTESEEVRLVRIAMYLIDHKLGRLIEDPSCNTKRRSFRKDIKRSLRKLYRGEEV